jgi:hypothetical protein
MSESVGSEHADEPYNKSAGQGVSVVDYNLLGNFRCRFAADLTTGNNRCN